MFTGIITHIGIVDKLGFSEDKDLLITLSTEKISERKLDIGCSIACNGVCLTLLTKDITQDKHIFSFQASKETLEKTTFKHLKVGEHLNLECAMRLGDELGGHMVSGHVDGCARIENIEVVKDSHRFTFSAGDDLLRFISKKGSVTLNGVSLTVNETMRNCFDINLISHTIDHTTFKYAKVGDLVNLEIDLLARYLDRLNK